MAYITRNSCKPTMSRKLGHFMTNGYPLSGERCLQGPQQDDTSLLTVQEPLPVSAIIKPDDKRCVRSLEQAFTKMFNLLDKRKHQRFCLRSPSWELQLREIRFQSGKTFRASATKETQHHSPNELFLEAPATKGNASFCPEKLSFQRNGDTSSYPTALPDSSNKCKSATQSDILNKRCYKLFSSGSSSVQEALKLMSLMGAPTYNGRPHFSPEKAPSSI